MTYERYQSNQILERISLKRSQLLALEMKTARTFELANQKIDKLIQLRK